ncbi:MAG: hypothetical protein HKN25_04755 [Pyrinomonadaceae bacterium]|nr:hypothetical protein [Pyrinomonadaceae bacterium]
MVVGSVYIAKPEEEKRRTRVNTMRKMFLIYFLLICGCTFSPPPDKGTVRSENVKSIESTLESSCPEYKPIKGTTFDFIVKCKGIGGYNLIYSHGLLFDKLSLLTSKGEEVSLDLWAKIDDPSHPEVSSVAEWRVIKKPEEVDPIALIVSASASSPGTHDGQGPFYYVVIKLTKSASCITDFVDRNSYNSSKLARELADSSQNKPCLFQNPK